MHSLTVIALVVLRGRRRARSDLKAKPSRQSTLSTGSIQCFSSGARKFQANRPSASRGASSSISSPLPTARPRSSANPPDTRFSSAECAPGWARPPAAIPPISSCTKGRSTSSAATTVTRSSRRSRPSTWPRRPLPSRHRRAPRHGAASSSSARSQPSAAPPRLDALTSYVESFSQIQKRPQGDATITARTMWSFPDRVRQERTMALAGQDDGSATILAPQGAWFVSGQGQGYPMRPYGRASLEQDFGRHPIALLRARRSPGFKAFALGTATVDGVRVETGPRHPRRDMTSRSPSTRSGRHPQRDLPRQKQRRRVRHVHHGVLRLQSGRRSAAAVQHPVRRSTDNRIRRNR